MLALNLQLKLITNNFSKLATKGQSQGLWHGRTGAHLGPPRSPQVENCCCLHRMSCDAQPGAVFFGGGCPWDVLLPLGTARPCLHPEPQSDLPDVGAITLLTYDQPCVCLAEHHRD